ncbi:hypothetical protein BJV74DRAFT_514768 [Russula compacta]|nr:hypothetical protein BJV74DRAFT_514768 [Russula compacta]
MFPLPMLATIPTDLDSMDSRYAFLYHISFIKNTILRALNNIHTLARELRCDDPRRKAFIKYIVGVCDVLVLYVHTEQCFFRTPVSAGVVLEKPLGEGCVPDMGKVVKMARELKELARGYADCPKDYDGCEIIARLSFGEEFSARSWVQIRYLDMSCLELGAACTEREMRHWIWKATTSFLDQPNTAFLIPFIHSHHDIETSRYWLRNSPEDRIVLTCLAKVHSSRRLWELAPFDISTGTKRRSKLHLSF